jgi:hypothetical protein
MESVIRIDELVENKDRKFGSNKYYYPVQVVTEDGHLVNALFTQDQINDAIFRAEKNPEDMPEISFWDWLDIQI